MVARFCGELNANISIRQVDPSPFRNVCAARKQSPAKFAPLLWDKYMDQVPDRIVYIDSDTRVMADAGRLLTCKLEGHAVGAVHDTAVISDDRVAAICHKLGISPDPGYFNSGVLLIDTERWRNYDIGRRAVQVLNDEQHVLTWNDQCALNKVLAGNWKPLPIGWNKLVGSTPREWPEYIAHFAGTYKPWTLGLLGHLPVMEHLVGKDHLDWYIRQMHLMHWPGFNSPMKQLRCTGWTSAAVFGELVSGHLYRHLARRKSRQLLQFAHQHPELVADQGC